MMTEQQHRTMNDKERNDYLESRETEILAFHSKVRTNNVLREVWDEARKEGREDGLKDAIDWIESNAGICDDEEGYIYLEEDCFSDIRINLDLLVADFKKALTPND